MSNENNQSNEKIEEEVKKSGFSIGKFSVQNPVLVTILMVSLLLLGLFSVLRLPQEQFAEVPFFWVNVIVPYPGVSAEDLEAAVTVPVENAFQGMNRLQRISSVTSEGLSVVRVEFDDGISNDEFRSLFQESQTRFSQVRLPDGVLSPLVDDFSSADFLPVVEVVVSGDLPYGTLLIESEKIRDRILRVKDVADVDLVGARDRQIILDIDPIRLSALGLSTGELLRAVQDQNQSVPGGTLKTGGREFLIRTLGGAENISDFGNIIVRRSEDSGGMIRVDDVAQVIDTFDPTGVLSRYNGEDAISLRVTKVPRGSSVSVVQGTRTILTEIEQDFPLGMSVNIFNDSTVQIASSLSVLTSNALAGLALLVIILWFFIGFRNAAITALGIPVTFALTFIVLEFLGETINTNTLFGLVLVLGLIVDHGIVIVENSFRLQQSGLNRHNAAILGTNQVVLPVIAATATTVAAFLPLMLIPGTIGKFLRVIPLTVAIALIVSTFEALFFLPSHFADWGKENRTKKNGRVPREPGWWFDGVKVRYEKFLKWMYRYRGRVLTAVLIFSLSTFGLIVTLQQDLFAAEDFSYFTIDITMPTGTAIERTDAMVREFESLLLPKLGNGEFQAIRTSVGTATGGSGSTRNSNIAQIIVDLTEQDGGRTRSIDEIILQVQSEAWYISGADQIAYRKAQNGPPVSSALSFRISGDNFQNITGVSQAVRNFLSSQEGVFNIEDDFAPGSPELQIRLNSERASALGVSVGSVGNFLRARFDGLRIGTFFENNQEVAILLRFGENRGYESLEQAFIPTEDGRLVPFSSVASIVQTGSLGSIRRVDGKREITITADGVEGLDLRPINGGVTDLWNNQLALQYPDVEFGVGGEFGEFQDLLIEIARVFLIGIFLIYLILGAQFNSYSQPFLILLSVPFAFVGVVLFLFLSGTPFSTTVLYAGVALAGIAVNDAIVLISFINELRAGGMSVREAILEAAGTRLRPIILTSLTTIAGLLPTALGIGGQSVVWGPMASTIVFGLIFSTLTALIIIPMLYGVLYDKTGQKSPRKIQKENRPVDPRLGVTPTLGFIVLIGGLLFVGGGSVGAQRYPDLTTTPSLTVTTNNEELNRFVEEWTSGNEAQSIGDVYSSVFLSVDEMNLSVSQLDSVVRINQANFSSTLEGRKPTLSFVTDPGRNPLYGYSFSEGGTPIGAPSSVTAPPSWSHQLGFGLGIRQPLPSAGSVTLNITNATRMNRSGTEGDWTWGQSPSLGLSLDQPLFLGPGILRLDHARNALEKAALEVESALEGREALVKQLALQGVRLMILRQTLGETKWVLQQQALFTRNELEQAEEDLGRGVVSAADIRRLRIGSDQLFVQIAELGTEIREIDQTLRSLTGGNTDLLVDLPLLPTMGSMDGVLKEILNIRENVPQLEQFLAVDKDYQDALRSYRLAELTVLGGIQADAPRIGLSLTLTPASTSGADTFGASVSDLFSQDDRPGFNLSFTLQASDLFRRTKKNLEGIQGEQLVQARIAMEAARSSLIDKIESLDSRREALYSILNIRLAEYLIASQDLREEEIRLGSGASNVDILRRRQLSEYSAAFRVLQSLREIEMLELEVRVTLFPGE